MSTSGWKTYVAAAGMLLLAVVDIANGNVQDGLAKLVGALGLFGLRHAIEKGG